MVSNDDNPVITKPYSRSPSVQSARWIRTDAYAINSSRQFDGFTALEKAKRVGLSSFGRRSWWLSAFVRSTTSTWSAGRNEAMRVKWKFPIKLATMCCGLKSDGAYCTVLCLLCREVRYERKMNMCIRYVVVHVLIVSLPSSSASSRWWYILVRHPGCRSHSGPGGAGGAQTTADDWPDHDRQAGS